MAWEAAARTCGVGGLARWASAYAAGAAGGRRMRRTASKL